MTSKDLLAYVMTGALEYIQNVVGSKNRADYNKLKKLFDEQRFEAKSFDDTDLDILSFDWQYLERDRNWWWQLQALPFLNWYTNSFVLQSDEEQSRYFSLCLDAIHAWVKQAKLNKESPLAWHDHATAFRVRNLTNWLAFCHSAGLVDEDARAKAIGSYVLSFMADWLSTLDVQSRSHIFAHPGFASWVEQLLEVRGFVREKANSGNKMMRTAAVPPASTFYD